jgi:hypothetical protein
LIYFIKKFDFTKIALSSFLFLIIFYKVPIDIYYYNQSQFNSYSFVLIPNLILFSLGIIFYNKIYNNKFFFKTFLIIGLYIAISKTLLPLDIGELEGHLELAKVKQSGIWIEIFSIIVSYTIVKNINKEIVKKIITIIAVVFFLFSSFYYLKSFEPTIKAQYNHYTQKLNSKETKNFNLKPNIYFLTFDAFSSFAFEELIKNNEIKSKFKGFIFYKNNSTNYAWTTLSVTSFHTGTMHNFDSSISEWMKLYRTEGIISEMINRNYDVWQYVVSTDMKHKDVKKFKTNVSLLLERSKSKLFIELYDYILLRVSPQFMHHKIYNNGSGILSKISIKLNIYESKSIPGEHYRTLGSKFLIEEMIKDEKLRPDKGVFLHAHIYLPHGPYVLNENAEYISESYDGKINVKRYFMQAEGTILLLNKYLNELKEQNKFRDSLIVINSDHGSWEIGLSKFPPEYSDRIDSISNNQRRIDAPSIFNQSKSLLLIKKPFTNNIENLKINEKKTQLLDIFPTIINFSDGNENLIKNTLGISLLDNSKIPEDRKTRFIVGYKQRKTPQDRWTTIKELKGGILDIFEISNNDFIKKLESKYTNW